MKSLRVLLHTQENGQTTREGATEDQPGPEGKLKWAGPEMGTHRYLSRTFCLLRRDACRDEPLGHCKVLKDCFVFVFPLYFARSDKTTL